MSKVKILLPHLIIPLLILIGGISIYYILSTVIVLLEPDVDVIVKLELLLKNQPDYAVNCGVVQQVESLKSLNSAISSFESALHNCLIGGTIGLFLISLAREFYIFNKLKENT